jgi:hypothetical protein
MPKTDTARGVHSGHRASSLRFRADHGLLPAHGVQARALVKLVLEGIAAPHHVIESYGCGELATLYDTDAGMITTINGPHGKINSEPKQLSFVRGGIQLSRRTSEAFDPANPDGCH